MTDSFSSPPAFVPVSQSYLSCSVLIVVTKQKKRVAQLCWLSDVLVCVHSMQGSSQIQWVGYELSDAAYQLTSHPVWHKCPVDGVLSLKTS